jgi:hypothetical protein
VPYTGVVGQPFLKQDLTRDGDWTMVANKDTTSRPAPQPSGTEEDLLPPWVPVVNSARATYTVYNEWTLSTSGWIDQYGGDVLTQNLGATHTLTLQVNGVVKDTFTSAPVNSGLYLHNITPLLVIAGAVLRVTVKVTQVSNDLMYWEQQAGLFATPPTYCSGAVGSKDGAAAGTTAYGCHLQFIPGVASPDWDVVAYGGAAAGGGGMEDAPLDGQTYGRQSALWAPVLPLVGGTLIGPLILAGDPSQSLEAATKQYVDGRIAIFPLSTIAALRANTVLTGSVWVRGFRADADGGEGMFVYASSDTTSTDNGGTIIVDASSRRWYREKESQPYSVRWFGAYGNGANDDTAAINACIAAAVASGRAAYFPAGTYNTTGPHTINGTIALKGDSATLSYLKTTHASNDIIAIAAQGVRINNLGLITSVTRTGGAYINCGNQTDVWIEDFSMSGYFHGVAINGSTQVFIRDGTMYNPVQSTPGSAAGSGGLYVIGSSPNDPGVKIHNVTMACDPAHQSAFGILVADCAEMIISDCDIMGHGVDLLIVPGNGQAVDSLWGDNTFFDTATVGIQITPTGTGVCTRSRFTGCWTCSHTQNGVVVEGAGCNGIHFIDHHGGLNTTGSGIYVASGAADINILGGLFGGNVNGITFDTAVTEFSVVGASSGNYGGFGANSSYGVEVGANTNSFIITNCRLRGNTVGGFGDGGSLTNKVVTNNLTA